MGQYKGFTQVELRRPKRSMFDLSHESRVSSRMGRLTPIVITETLPNDTFRMSAEVYIKLAPMIAPIFHRLNLYVHFFFVPNRLLWEDWEEFITGGRLGGAVETPPVPPNVLVTDILAFGEDYLDTGSLADYLGIPSIADASAPSYVAGQTIDVMPFYAYQKCYMDYYRDRNFVADDLITDGPLPSGNITGPILSSEELYKLRNRAWMHDYFTSAAISTQRGAEVLMPLGGSASVVYEDEAIALDTAVPGVTPAGALSVSGAFGNIRSAGDPSGPLTIANIASVDLDSSTVSINDFRTALALQQWLERNQLAGSRYNESIMAHFGRKTSDGRLQRAEYLGGGKAVVKIDEVMTTAYSEDADTNIVPPANPTGKGAAYSTSNSFTYNCEEHGFIVGILSVMPTSAYFQGMPNMFTRRRTFYDYPWPSFANLGEQPVYYKELYWNAADTSPEPSPIFGYQSRYADWKKIDNTAHGDFRTSLDFWHLARKFSGIPTLGETFVTFQDAEQDRIFNVAGVDTLWMYIYNSVKVVRSLPYFGVPAGLAPNSL